MIKNGNIYGESRERQERGRSERGQVVSVCKAMNRETSMAAK